MAGRAPERPDRTAAEPTVVRTAWRVTFVVSGLLFLAGGITHPPGGDEPVRESLVTELAHAAWPLSHGLLLAAAVLRVGALLLVLRDAPVRRRLGTSLSVALLAGSLFALEMVPHLLADRDLEALRSGGPTPTLDLYLVAAAVTYPIMGVAMAWLAWSFGRIGGVVAKVVAVVGAFGSLVYGMAPPLSLLSDGALNILFPLGAIPHAWWLVLLGLIGPGLRRTTSRTPTHEAAGQTAS